MPTPKKIEIVKELNTSLKKAKSIVLLAYQGLKTGQTEQLKKELEKSDSQMMVAKNTLMARAFEEQKIDVPEDSLAGPTALVLSFKEGFEGLKALVKYTKTLGADFLKIKASYFENQVFNSEQTLVLAALPDRKQLVAKFLGILNSPMQRLVNDLKSGQMKLVFVLDKVSRLRQV